MNVYQGIFKKLDELTGGIIEFSKDDNYKKLKSDGFMDLTIECNQPNVISLTHYYEVEGDLIPDPDMLIRINPELEMAEALTFQNSFIYQVVYPEPGKYYPKLKKELNSFLNQWLTNIKNQGFIKN